MTESKTLAVRLGDADKNSDEVVCRFGGDDPEIYRVSDGVVRVPRERVERFLGQFEGSEVVGGNPDDNTK